MGCEWAGAAPGPPWREDCHHCHGRRSYQPHHLLPAWEFQADPQAGQSWDSPWGPQGPWWAAERGTCGGGTLVGEEQEPVGRCSRQDRQGRGLEAGRAGTPGEAEDCQGSCLGCFPLWEAEVGSQGQVGAQWLAPVRTGQTQVVWLPILSSGTQPQGPSSWSALRLCPCLTPMSLPSGTGLAGFPSCHPRRNGPELMGLQSMDQARLRPWPVPEPLPWVSVLGRTRASVTMGPGRSASLELSL